MIQVANLWKDACKKAYIKSGEVYFSEENESGDFSIHVFDAEGGFWEYIGGGSDE